jgi:hypothetical protein
MIDDQLELKINMNSGMYRKMKMIAMGKVY